MEGGREDGGGRRGEGGREMEKLVEEQLNPDKV